MILAFCPMCLASDESRIAFFATTVLLSLLPLAMIGGLWWYLRHRAQGSVDSFEVRSGNDSSQN